MQLGQEAHQVLATSRVSILQSLHVSLVAGVYSIQPGIATAAAGSHAMTAPTHLGISLGMGQWT